MDSSLPCDYSSHQGEEQMNEKPTIITTLSQQFEVYQAIKDKPELVERWEILMRAFEMTDEEFALIKGENK